MNLFLREKEREREREREREKVKDTDCESQVQTKCLAIHMDLVAKITRKCEISPDYLKRESLKELRITVC